MTNKIFLTHDFHRIYKCFRKVRKKECFELLNGVKLLAKALLS